MRIKCERGTIGVVLIVDKIRENKFGWFDHVMMRENSETVM